MSGLAWVDAGPQQAFRLALGKRSATAKAIYPLFSLGRDRPIALAALVA